MKYDRKPTVLWINVIIDCVSDICEGTVAARNVAVTFDVDGGVVRHGMRERDEELRCCGCNRLIYRCREIVQRHVGKYPVSTYTQYR